MSEEPSMNEKWTEIELLPEWEEEFYDVYTAKKYGRWLMLKTLKPQLRGVPEYEAMLEREFDVRYNLAHAHIIMINDLEEVPGLGRCIITDDVYGDSLRKLIDNGKVTPEIVHKITHQLVEAIDYVQTNHIVHHPIRPERVIFTENVQNLKLIDVGFDQKNSLAPAEITDDVRAFGLVLTEALDACPAADTARLRAVADCCLSPFPYQSVQSLQMALAGNSARRFYVTIIAVLAVTVALLCAILLLNPQPN
jgi:serine/threonine protein kinase